MALAAWWRCPSPVSPSDDRAELNVGVLEFGDALKPALADERPDMASRIAQRPQPSFFQQRSLAWSRREVVERLRPPSTNHRGGREERGGLVVGAPSGKTALVRRRCVHPDRATLERSTLSERGNHGDRGPTDHRNTGRRDLRRRYGRCLGRPSSNCARRGSTTRCWSCDQHISVEEHIAFGR